MEKIKINCLLDENHIRISSKNVITGNISISIANCDFPELQWDDFVTRLLEMWLSSAIKILNGSDNEDFPFMEGSFGFYIKYSNNMYQIECYENDLIVIDKEISLSQFMFELIQVCKTVMSYVNKQNWEYNYSENFISILEKIETQFG